MTRPTIPLPYSNHPSVLRKDAAALLEERQSIRKFLDKRVPREDLEAVLNLAQRAPSSKNTQPWQITVVGGNKAKHLSEVLLEAASAGTPIAPDYQHSPNPLPPEWKNRAKKCGIDLFALKGIGRYDLKARKEHDLENFRLFNAPQGLVLHCPRVLETGCTRGNYLDCGMYLMQLMHALRCFGIDACAQYSICFYSPILREQLQIPDNHEIMAFVSFGYADENALVNTYRTTREPVSEFCNWHWDEE